MPSSRTYVRKWSIMATAVIVGVAGTAYASTALALEQDVDLAGAGMAELGDPDATAPTSPAAGTPSTVTNSAAAAVAAPVELQAGPVDDTTPQSTLTQEALAKLTKPQLSALIERTRVRWLALQAELGALEMARDTAEAGVDTALAAYGKRLLALFDAQDSLELEPLRKVRTETDPAVRTQLLANLRPEDAALVRRYDAAIAAATTAGGLADTKRSEAAVASADLTFAREFRDGRLPKSASAEPAFNAKHVFATGPIPSIGYFGAATGTGILGGWTGLAGAALGGVGCSAPDAALQASGITQEGQASWYGPGFHGQNTANGEVYDQEAMTAAHKSLPFGTIVKVYSTTTGRCAFVRINDRGPYIDGRIIDLSHAGATAIGMEGTAAVKIEIWAMPGSRVMPIVDPSPSEWPAEARATAPVAAASTSTR